jgi:arylsulfatase A-like enzyme
MVKDFRFCQTLGEIGERLAKRSPGDPPVFAYSLSQDIHVSAVTREGGRSVDDAAYPGFSAAVASRIRRFDACFGHFVDTLHRLGLFEDSVIILMSDHGDSLGEEGRVGHAYGLFPEVIRIPLIVSLPARLRSRFGADVAAPVFNTDVTPTLYRLLGHELAPSTPLFGRPLYAPPGERAATRADTMVASSYGAVYGALLDGATRLYIVDSVNVREYGYALAPDARDEAIAVDAKLRSRGQTTIRATIQALADLHGYEPKP